MLSNNSLLTLAISWLLDEGAAVEEEEEIERLFLSPFNFSVKLFFGNSKSAVRRKKDICKVPCKIKDIKTPPK